MSTLIFHLTVLITVTKPCFMANWGTLCKGQAMFKVNYFLTDHPTYEYGLEICDIHYTTDIRIVFDKEVTVKMVDPDNVTIIYTRNLLEYRIRSNKNYKYSIFLSVTGKTKEVAHPSSIKVNDLEFCRVPKIGFLNLYNPEKCGRRKVFRRELITRGEPTAHGEWPWHVAVYLTKDTMISYHCAGTLITKDAVLTVTHCTTDRGSYVNPDKYYVYLGKHHLFRTHDGNQIKEVKDIIIHEDYQPSTLKHDISIMLMKSEAQLGDYVQTACLWPQPFLDKFKHKVIKGTVVGWGINEESVLTNELRRVDIPMVSHFDCVATKPEFFGKLITGFTTFCAGLRNGSSPCNGDSGGGFLVLVNDDPTSGVNAGGAYYLRGMVSVGYSKPNKNSCDPNQYVVFTDVSYYLDWILDSLY